jgi:hypothetical protein
VQYIHKDPFTNAEKNYIHFVGQQGQTKVVYQGKKSNAFCYLLFEKNPFQNTKRNQKANDVMTFL